MPAIARISIADGQGTPVTHNYDPIETRPQTYQRMISGNPAIGAEELKADIKRSTGVNGVNKITIDLAIPVMEQASGGAASGYVAPPAVAHVVRGKIELYAHARSTDAQRKDVRVLLSNLLKDAQIVALIDNLERAV
jgi:hypothetical protein